ncbi:MAG: hypothetical protein RIC56_22025 [Pseudomonadales bacterium]
MSCILELNDAAITLYRDETVLQRSPGVAMVLDDRVCFGDEALRLSRIHPRQTNQQYFTRLNADPLPAPGRRARNHADLVYLHLQSLKPQIDAEGGEVLVAVPGILSADQLGVLLGVFQEVGIGVSGFVDAAVAALSTRELVPHAYHLDVMMQRAVVTTIDADGQVRKSAAQEVQECGLNRLIEGWINVIADRFVRETRFDPLHAAATEQQLFNQVYDWVDAGAESAELVVEIVHADHTRRVELARSLLEEKSAQRLRQLSDAVPSGSHLYLSARSARLPGLSAALETLQIEAEALPADALVRGCLRHLDQIVPGDGELRLVTRLPGAPSAATARAEAASTTAPASATAPAAVVSSPAEPPASHALRNHRAWPLRGTGSPLPLEHHGDRPLLKAAEGVRLNGAAVTAASPLKPGDRVVVGADEYLIIHVSG